MPHRLTTTFTTLTSRLRSGSQAGQGTVEYVALILLVAGVLAVAVAAASKSTFRLDQVVSQKLTDAITQVSGGKK